MEKSNLAPASFPAGHVSRAMLSRYSHVRMEAKRRHSLWLHKGCTNDSGNITPKLIF